MALRDQPYLPLYIQDFMTDEKLIECSAEATGVYIRLMCIFHKSDEYGKILLKQKDKQTNKPLLNFACKIAKQMPYDFPVVERSLVELLDEKVLHIEGDYLLQRRMVKDNALSLVRSEAGRKGGNFAQAKVKAKPKANAEYEYENEIVAKEKKERTSLKEKSTKVQFNPLDHIPEKWNGDLFLVEWADFMIMRKKKKWSCAENVLIRRLRQLRELSGDDWGIASAIIQKSSEKGYAEFFALTPKNGQVTHQNGHDPRFSKTFVRDKA